MSTIPNKDKQFFSGIVAAAEQASAVNAERGLLDTLLQPEQTVV